MFTFFVMAAIGAAIQRRASASQRALDGRVKPGNDGMIQCEAILL